MLIKYLTFLTALAILLTPTQARNYKWRKIAEDTLQKLLSENYNKNLRPPSAEDSDDDSTVVTVNIFVKNIEYIDDIKMEYGLELYFRQHWLDQRLSYNLTEAQNGSQSADYLTLEDRSRIWEPNLNFANSKHGTINEVLAPNYFIRIFPTGEIRTSYRISLKLSCPMDLRMYPFDRPVCPALIESYSLSEEDLQVHWKNSTPVSVTKVLHLPHFSLKRFSTTYCSSTTSTGTYACLKLDFKFEREVSYYLYQIYIPCFMLVVISWISFWLDESAVDARISLGVTTILTIVTQIYGINQTTPTVSYTKALDVFTGTCECFVVAVLLEFSLVNHMFKKEQKKTITKQFLDAQVEHGGQTPLIESNPLQTEVKTRNAWPFPFPCRRGKIMATTVNKIDQVARVAFPVSFFIFNLVYWAVYVKDLDDYK